MIAVVASQAGGPEVLEVRELPRPKPGPGEVLIEVAACGVNFIDTYHRSGIYAVDYPFALGLEASGTIVELGDGVTSFSVGDRIATSQARGAYAEFCIVPAEHAFLVPEGIDLRVAAAVPLQGLTAHYLITSASHPEPGDTVLVHAGAGGVGQLLIQMLTARGIRVLATASTDEKRSLCLSAGAAEAFGYEDFAGSVRELTAGEGVAVVYDGVGKTTFDESLASLRVRGEMVLFGGSSGQVPPFDLQRLNSGGSLSITRPSLAHFIRTEEERAWRFREVFDAVADGTLAIRIDHEFPLTDAAAAHRALEARQTTGKVLLVPHSKAD